MLSFLTIKKVSINIQGKRPKLYFFFFCKFKSDSVVYRNDSTITSVVFLQAIDCFLTLSLN